MPPGSVNPASHELLSIQLHSLDEQAVLVRPHGELDPLTAPLLDYVLDDQLAHNRRVVLDLTEVWYLGSYGLSVLERIGRRSRRRATCFEVIAPEGHIAHRVATLLRSAILDRAGGARLPEPRTASPGS